VSRERTKEQLLALEAMEVALVRADITRPGIVSAREETILRTALSLARLTVLRFEGQDFQVRSLTQAFRDEVLRRLGPALQQSHIEHTGLYPHIIDLHQRTQQTLSEIADRLADRLPSDVIDAEIRTKELVLVLGGGGGSAYVYLGVMALLEDWGLTPKLMVGTSMGAILALFRARLPRFAADEIASIVRTLSWRKLFRMVSMENRYGVPAALRLFLRSCVGRWFGVTQARAEGPTLRELHIPVIVAVSGIRVGKLPHALTFYEGLTEAAPDHLLRPRVLPRWLAAVGELAARPELTTTLHLGADDETAEFDALDAAGFSSALPGVVHYDLLRDDPRMHALLESMLRRRRVARLVDGGLVDNLPAQAAWDAVRRGRIGTRNALVVALNGFAFKALQPAWWPLMGLAELNVRRNRRWAHLTHEFGDGLSPLNVVPSVTQTFEAIDIGRRAFAPTMPLLRRLLTPLARLETAG
jgi:hypothetical protein